MAQTTHLLTVEATPERPWPYRWRCSCRYEGGAESRADAQRKFAAHFRPAPKRCPGCGCRRLDYQPMMDGTITAVCTKCSSEWSGYAS